MGISLSGLSKDSVLRKKIEEKLQDDSPPVQKNQQKTLFASKAWEQIKPCTSFSNRKVFHVKPMGKPRMTQRDKWKKRPVVERYKAFCDQIRLQRKNFELPIFNVWMVFHIPMPKSWSKKKQNRYHGCFHTQRPDRDNIDKAVMDALMKEDSISADARITKVWCSQGEERVEIYY